MSEFPKDDDGAVLKNLRAKGVDLSKPRMIEFYCYAPSLGAARKISSEIEELQFETDIFENEDVKDDTKRYSVYSTIRMVPSYEGIVTWQRTLNKLLEKHNTSCDGWGTLVEN